jgi:FkbM family methyltransferase
MQLKLKKKHMDRLIIKIYELLPDFIKKSVSGRNKLRFVKDFFLKDKNGHKTTKVKIQKSYDRIKVEFNFVAPVRIALKAKKRGVESTLLRNSFYLLNKFSKNSNLIIYDVGANYGFLSLVWAKATLKRNGFVFCFEPSPTVSKITEKNIFINGLNNTKLLKKAVGNMNGSIKIYDSLTTSNIEPTDNSKPVDVEIITLDMFSDLEQIEKVDLIKIDVDGIELDILNGAKKVLEKYKPILIVETNDDSRILEFLWSLDYTILNMKLKKVKKDENIPHNIFAVDETAYNNVYEIIAP